jgi:hypothetical protein
LAYAAESIVRRLIMMMKPYDRMETAPYCSTRLNPRSLFLALRR